MVQVTTKIDDKILIAFRDAIYTKSGLRRGDLKFAIEESMKAYVEKYRPQK